MRGRDEDRARLGPLLHREIHIDSLIVDWNWAQLRAGGAKGKACAGKARILNPDLITGIKEYLRDRVESVLCALDDKNLFRRATHGTGYRETLCNCFSQRRESSRVTVVEQRRRRMARGFRQMAGPAFPRKQIERRKAVPERANDAPAVHAIRERYTSDAPSPGREMRVLIEGPRHQGRNAFADSRHRIDIGSGADGPRR